MSKDDCYNKINKKNKKVIHNGKVGVLRPATPQIGCRHMVRYG